MHKLYYCKTNWSGQKETKYTAFLLNYSFDICSGSLVVRLAGLDSTFQGSIISYFNKKETYSSFVMYFILYII